MLSMGKVQGPEGKARTKHCPGPPPLLPQVLLEKNTALWARAEVPKAVFKKLDVEIIIDPQEVAEKHTGKFCALSRPPCGDVCSHGAASHAGPSAAVPQTLRLSGRVCCGRV